jgi:hypothetical protein
MKRLCHHDAITITITITITRYISSRGFALLLLLYPLHSMKRFVCESKADYHTAMTVLDRINNPCTIKTQTKRKCCRKCRLFQ